jgi:hypothetical protein
MRQAGALSLRIEAGRRPKTRDLYIPIRQYSLIFHIFIYI